MISPFKANHSIRFRAKKSLGQNFLMHARIAQRIALVARLPADAVVLEIGPGTGVLTRVLLQYAQKVVAIEADEKLFKKLQNDFANEVTKGQLKFVHGDIRDYVKRSAHFCTVIEKLKYDVVANIPYYLTGEIFRMFLEIDNQPRSMTLLVQKEVADRIVARDGKESLLSLSIKAYGEPKREFVVPRGAFRPSPNVDSAVLTIRNISRRNFNNKNEEKLFFKLLHSGFAHKRKYVRKNLIKDGFPSGDVREKSRAEDLLLADWLKLSKEHKRYK